MNVTGRRESVGRGGDKRGYQEMKRLKSSTSICMKTV
jgi:hypothetical protein